jgi:digeranylgeranylglycerophospholipid reductase
MTTHEYDLVIIGAGTAGCYAGATAADAGLDVVIVERKAAEEAGHIACGDALKGADTFPDAIPKSTIEPAFTNTAVDHGRFEIPETDTVLEIPIPGELAVIDRLAYGRKLIEGANAAGTDFHYDTVVSEVSQNGAVTGVRGKRKGDAVSYEAPIVLDGAGALSILQDKADLSGSTFDTNVTYSQFCSAYREVLEVPEPVSWDDALVFKPTDRSAGYLWYFPRTNTEINAGLGFQMHEQPMELVRYLKRDLRNRPEFDGAEVLDKLGAALPTRRPYDSAVAPGFMAAGDAAGHVNPTTGGGIAGAAYAGTYAAEQAIEAISAGTTHEEGALWEYNKQVMDHFGARFATLDVYNIFVSATDVTELKRLLSVLPGEKLAEALYSGSASLGLGLMARIARRSIGHWQTIYDLYRTKNLADDLLEIYETYPTDPTGFDAWQARRDRKLDEIYAVAGADPKY